MKEHVKTAAFLLIAFCLGTAVVWAFGEAAVRAVSARKLIYDVEMVKYARDLKMRDPEGVNSHVHRPSAAAELMGVTIALNSLGERGPEPAPKNAKLKRILVLGSSVTMGWGVPQEQVFTSLVAAKLNAERPFGDWHFELDNAGIGNYDTLAELNLLKRDYPKLRPDAVVLHYFINDAEPRTRQSNSALLKHSFLAAYLYGRARLALMAARHESLAGHYAELYGEASPAWSAARGEIAAMNEIAKKDGAPFLVMIIPDIHNLAADTPYAGVYQKIERDLAAMGIPVLNAFGDFQARFGADASRLWIQPDDPHPNPAGHALMAELLERYLVEKNPLRLPRRHAL